MTVYVDNMRARYSRMIMCHVIADSTEELVAAVEAVGVRRKWIQSAGTSNEHFDVCLKAKAKLIENGAVEITWRELGQKLRERRLVGS